ncbi:hypothetical protein H0W91_00645 [Patescibacteria group bacterium]|nr:hypothetical protein [Patescibacteria group bacterium]
MTRAIPHVNICGYPGAGKTTVAILLWQRYRTTVIRQYTTRVLRAGESETILKEYNWITNEEYKNLYNEGKLLKWDSANSHKVNPDGSEYFRGIPASEFWVKPKPDTQLILSMFSTRAAPEIKQKISPEMINICLVADDLILKERILSRFGRDYVGGHSDTIAKYRGINIEGSANFEPNHVIDTGELDAEQVAEKIAYLAGLLTLTLP